MAQRVLAALALRGGVHLLLAQLQPEVLDTAPEMLGPARDVPPPPPLTTDVLEAALGALVAYFRVAPLEVSLAAAELEAEAWLVARIPSWARVQAPNTAPLMSRSVCDALLLLATSMSGPYERRPELGRAAIPSVLLGTARCTPLPSCSATSTFSKYVDEPPKTTLPPETTLSTPTRRVIWCMRRRRGRIRSGAVAGAYGAASGGGSGSTSSSTEASHGHGRAVVGSSSSSGGQARHAPLWARHGALSAALLLKDSLCVVHLFEDARRIGTTLSSPPTTETTGRRTGRDQPRRTGRRDALVHANGTEMARAVPGSEMARAVPGAEVAASVTPLVNFGRVHVSLLVLLRCVPPSARAVAGAEQEHAARLSLRLLAQLPRLPPPRLKAGQLPPFASPDSRGHSGELPRPGAASSAPTTRVIWCKRRRPQPGARYGTRWAQHGARSAQYGARWARRTQLARCAV
jgi:hypothetical protein